MKTFAIVSVAVCTGLTGGFLAIVATSSEMMSIAEGFRPHASMCLAGEHSIVLLSSLGDLVTGAAYMIVPLALLAFARLAQEYPGAATSHVVVATVSEFWPLFVAFVFFCGVGHFMKYATLHWPMYWELAAWTFFGTGLLSIATAAALWLSYVSARDALRAASGISNI